MSSGVETSEGAEAAGKRIEVCEDHVFFAAERGAPCHVICGLIQRWAGWRGKPAFGRVVGRVFEDPDILEYGFAPWVSERKILVVCPGVVDCDRVFDCVREMEQRSERMALPGLCLEGWGKDFEGLIPSDSIVEIKLSWDEKFGEFCEWLSGGGAPLLQTLDLRDNQHGDERMRQLSDALSTGVLSSLRLLDVYNNEFGDEGMRSISAALSGGALRSLQILSLGNNEIKVEGMRAFTEALSRGALPSLRDLDIQGNGSEGISVFLKALLEGGVLPSIRALNFEANGIDPEGFRIFFEALSSRELQLLQSLYIGNNLLGVKGMRLFSRALSVSSSLHDLSLERSEIGIEGLHVLSETLVGGKLPQLRSLDLSSNELGFEGMLVISEALSRGALTSLCSLILAYNQFDEKVLQVFLEAVSQGALPSLHMLDLSMNYIRTSGLLALSEAVADGALPSLLELSLRSNSIGFEAILVFAEALSRGALPSLRTLDLEDNYTSTKAQKDEIRELLARIPTLFI